ncbi:MAG: peptidylprolyl isomerase, partial [Acidimicrobiia bacterium]|nr:peptidylprolyl isomerase [Acidimicrobiia bacterium]
MATGRRERQRANRALKQEIEQKVEKHERRRQVGLTAAIIAIAVMAGLGLLYVATRGGDDEVATDDPATEEVVEETTTSTIAGPVSAISVPAPGGTIQGPTECPSADGSSERITTFSEAPPTCIDPSASYTATIATTSGDITVQLDAAAAPETVNNFVVLSRYHYYDGTPFHRIIPGFVIQGGDATGPSPGLGNPGYLIAEEPPAEPADGETAYEIGSFAMAKGPGPSATGAQFFIVTGPSGEALPPEYSLFGQVTEGMDVVTAIESIPTTGSPQDAP